MAARRKEPPIIRNETILQQPMEEIIHQSMMPYAEHVILERALPRVEDGLKPVQRRILYTMMELGITPDKPHRKSARIVGDTMGKYHPHGDSSIYDAMVRMAQDFSMRMPLVDGHGNFGSIDGDGAAAMRYTEARMDALALELLRDIDKQTVPFGLNYDDALKEPEILPGRFPNLLVNGASGIAVGLATNIPPHNLGEAIDAVIAQIDNPDITLEEMMQKYISGPDFPTGGIIVSDEQELCDAYQSGRGKIYVRAKVDIEPAANGKKNLVITEIPYQVNKARMLEDILKLSEEKKQILSAINDIRDESDRTGMRAVIELKKDADAQKILQYLYQYSDLQVTFGINMVAIAQGRPLQMGLLEMNRHYIEHQKNVVKNRTIYDLEHARAREHILQGLLIAIANIDRVIAIIRASKNPAKAREALEKEFVLSSIQAQAILDMRLARLTNLEVLELQKELEQIQQLISLLEAILSSEKKLMDVVKKELQEVRKQFANPRRTRFSALEAQPPAVKHEDLQPVEDVAVILSCGGYIKRIGIKSFQRSSRELQDAKPAEIPSQILYTATDQKLLCFTNTGGCYTIDVSAIPEARFRERGGLLASLAGGFQKDERAVSLLSVPAHPAQLLFYTVQGMIKNTDAQEFGSRRSRVQAIALREKDWLLGVEALIADTPVMMITSAGMSIQFKTDDIPSMKRTAAGVKAIALDAGDEVIFARQVSLEGEIAVITDQGYAKRSLVVDYDVQGRNGKGARTIDFRANSVNGRRCMAAFYVREPFDMLISQKSGHSAIVNTEEIPIDARNAKGFPLVLVVLDDQVENIIPIRTQ